MATPSDVFQVIPTCEEAWQKVKGAKASIFLVVLTILGVGFITGLLGGLINVFLSPKAGDIWMNVCNPIITLLSLILSWGILYIGIQRAAGMPVFYRMIKTVFSFELILKMIGVYVLMVLILVVPFLILFAASFLLQFVGTPDSAAWKIGFGLLSAIYGITALYLMIRMILTKAIVIAERKGPIQALKISFAATKDLCWKLLGFLIFQFLVVIVSIIPLGIGLIWSIPYCTIAYGLVYRKLVALRTDLVV
jgi:MFS family permease